MNLANIGHAFENRLLGHQKDERLLRTQLIQLLPLLEEELAANALRVGAEERLENEQESGACTGAHIISGCAHLMSIKGLMIIFDI